MGKIILIIIDGLGGLPTSILQNRTALEAANIPNMDYFAEKGQTGLIKNFKTDQEDFLSENGSNYGGISLLGVNPETTSWKRGPIEAIGIGANFQEGDVAARFNYAYMNSKGLIEDRRAGRVSNEEAKAFTQEIREKTKYQGEYELKHSLRHRGIILLKSKQALGEDVQGSDPLKERQPPKQITVTKRIEANIRTANLLHTFEQKTNEVLSITKLNTGRRSKGGYPITHIITRGIGTKLPELPVYNDFAAICTTPVEFGLAKLSNMQILGIEKPEEDYKKDTEKTLEILKEEYDEHDKILIFLKGPDTYGHQGASLKKKTAIEHIDKTIISFIREKFNQKEDVLCITSDHATPTRLMRHAAQPIPTLISGKIKPDSTTKFGEKHIKNGELTDKHGWELMPALYKLYRQ